MAQRRDLFDPTDPAILRNEQLLAEIAAIFAASVVRMCEQRAATGPRLRSCRNETSLTAPVVALCPDSVQRAFLPSGL